MKQGKSISELASQLDYIAANYKDFNGSTESVTAVGNGDLTLDLGIEGRDPSPLTDVAHSQVAASLKIPKVYYDRCRVEDPELLAHNLVQAGAEEEDVPHPRQQGEGIRVRPLPSAG